MSDGNPFGDLASPQAQVGSWIDSNPLALSYAPTDAPSPQALGVNPLLPSPAPSGSSPDAAKKMVLDRIASGEANSYNELYKGGSFGDFSDHPRIRQTITEGPYQGQTSDAAGRYQFLSSTWDQERTKLGLKDFSPPSQDAAAWDLASTTYKGATGRDLISDAQQGKVDYSKLAGQWPSLSTDSSPDAWKASAKQAGLTDEQIASLTPVEVDQFKQWHNAIHGGGGAAGTSRSVAAGSPSQIPQAPDGQSQDMNGLLRLALIQAAFPKHKFSPIDYDPFKVQQEMQVRTPG